MVARDVTLAGVEGIDAQSGEVDVAFEMDEAAFRAFYDRTARPLWAYLARLTGDPQAADDLLQECYYRLLRVGGGFDGDAHRRAYLFRIATNLVRDRHRRTKHQPPAELTVDGASAPGPDAADTLARRADVHRAMARLTPRERALLWLAYAHGHPHAEIARVLGVKTGSVKLLLFRARRKLADLLRGRRGRGGTDARS